MLPSHVNTAPYLNMILRLCHFPPNPTLFIDQNACLMISIRWFIINRVWRRLCSWAGEELKIMKNQDCLGALKCRRDTDKHMEKDYCNIVYEREREREREREEKEEKERDWDGKREGEGREISHIANAHNEQMGVYERKKGSKERERGSLGSVGGRERGEGEEREPNRQADR